MKITGLLPIGSVVLLKETTKKIMISGICQSTKESPDVIYDYVGVPFPEGYINADNNFIFNMEDIDKIYFLGYQDAELVNLYERIEGELVRLKHNNERKDI